MTVSDFLKKEHCLTKNKKLDLVKLNKNFTFWEQEILEPNLDFQTDFFIQF